MSDSPSIAPTRAAQSDDQRSETLLRAQKQSLEMVVRGAPLPQVMAYLTRVVEEQAAESVASSIVALEADGRLRTLAAPSLPVEFSAAVDTLTAIDGVGACPSAAATGKPVITADIATHPNWAGHTEAPLALGLRGVWSQPILSRDGRVLGAFATYFRTAREPSSIERRLIETLSQTAALAIERAEAEAQIERHRRDLDLALDAADMGTWRYDLTDRICDYSARAQKLFGLNAARYLHDEAGADALFHPDDLAPIRRALETACAPHGAGRYEVEFRVRRGDGWRWLSSWGVTEFEGPLSARRALAIVGASRDITKRKLGEQHQRLMVNELNHRVKNTLATVQSIIAQTLRATPDVKAAQARIEERILSLARAHDILTIENWSGADLSEVVARALEPFQAPLGGEIAADGPAVRLSPQQALALAMAIHELATNAVKYGALSQAGGRVGISWETVDAALAFRWAEAGGPAVVAPSRKGFGARLLERGLASEFGGKTRLDFAPGGVTFEVKGRL